MVLKTYVSVVHQSMDDTYTECKTKPLMAFSGQARIPGSPFRAPVGAKDSSGRCKCERATNVRTGEQGSYTVSKVNLC